MSKNIGNYFYFVKFNLLKYINKLYFLSMNTGNIKISKGEVAATGPPASKPN